MDKDSPFRNFSIVTPRKGSGSRKIYIIFCNSCSAHWLSPTIAQSCVKCGDVQGIECLKEYETKAPKV